MLRHPPEPAEDKMAIDKLVTNTGIIDLLAVL